MLNDSSTSLPSSTTVGRRAKTPSTRFFARVDYASDQAAFRAAYYFFICLTMIFLYLIFVHVLMILMIVNRSMIQKLVKTMIPVIEIEVYIGA